ncbi:MAG: DUF488 family protein [Actinomycetota bacterium]
MLGPAAPAQGPSRGGARPRRGLRSRSRHRRGVRALSERSGVQDGRPSEACPQPATRSDGYRVLIDRLWPRGVSRERAIDAWQELAPSTGLREWFGHEPRRFDEFRRRYIAELRDRRPLLAELRRRARGGAHPRLRRAGRRAQRRRRAGGGPRRGLPKAGKR